MNARKNPFGKLTARLLAAALVATALCAATTMNATPVFQGKFSLPYEVRWGKAMLPPGEYSLRVEYVDTATIVTVQRAEGGNKVAMLLSQISEKDNTKGGSALLIASKGGQRIVHSLKLAELGEVFIYDPSLARGLGTTEEARQTQPVRVLAAK